MLKPPRSLKLAHKIILMIAAFAVPLVVVSIYFVTKGLNKDIAFADQELAGNEYLRPLITLLDAIPQHQSLAARTSEDPLVQEALAARQLQIEKAFGELEVVQAKHGARLQFTDEGLAKRNRQSAAPKLVKAAWTKLKADLPNLHGAQIADAHKPLIASIRAMIAHAGDTSNLILDPDLDSYYLMDVTLLALPQTQDRLGVVTAFGADVLQRDEVTSAETVQLAVHAAQLKESDAERINGSLDTARNEDAAFYGLSETLQRDLAVPQREYNDANTAFIAAITAAATDHASVQPVDFIVAGERTRAAAAKLWTASVKELDTLLQTRVHAIETSRFNGLLVAGGSLALSTLIALLVLRGITGPLAALTSTAEKITKGDNSARAPVLSGDEIGELASSFNQMVEARATVQTKVEQENKELQEQIRDLLVVVSDASDGRFGVRAKVGAGAMGNIADALNLMFENVGELIAKAKEASDKVGTASQQITTAAKELEESDKTQSRELGETSTGVQDLNLQAQHVLTNCHSANEAADKARAAADQGATAVREVISAMDRIRENVQTNVKKIKRLGDRSLEIGGLVKVIGEISAKTDMLALNASIEASRAGEQGRGFNVVAEQVRILADRTRSLTSQVEKLVTDIQQETSEASQQMEAQTQEVEIGARAAASAGGTLENIVEASTRSHDLVAAINDAATQQAARAKEMLVTVESINRTAEAAQKRVVTTRSTSEQLSALSTQLDQRLSQFDLAA